MAATETSTEATYAGRLQAHRAEAARQSSNYRNLGRGRGVAVALIVILIILTEKEITNPPKALVLLPAVASVFLIVRWNQAARSHQRAVRAGSYYVERLACLKGQWAGQGDAGQVTVGGVF